MRREMLLLGTMLGLAANAGPATAQPAFEDIYSLTELTSPRLAPDGRTFAYRLRTPDWTTGGSDAEIYLRDADGAVRQLTYTENGSAGVPAWRPDGTQLAYLARAGDGSQVFAVAPAGGAPVQLTNIAGGVEDFLWSPDGAHLLLWLAEPANAAIEAREAAYGAFEVEDEPGGEIAHLWMADVGGAPIERGALRRLTSGAFSVETAAFSPDGARIVFSHTPLTPESRYDDDISLIDAASGAVTPLVVQSGEDQAPMFSPDGRAVLFSTKSGRRSIVAMERLAIVDIATRAIRLLDIAPTGEASAARWTEAGIYFAVQDGMSHRAYLYDVARDAYAALPGGPGYVSDIDANAAGDRALMIGETPRSLSEIYLYEAGRSARRLTDSTGEQIADWPAFRGEAVQWTSPDGRRIEGALFAPLDARRGGRRPLLVVMHGGPIGADRVKIVHDYVYPIEEWQARGAYVLMPNFRGSDGYGEEFRAAVVGDIGGGDVADVMAGIDQLIAEGLVDSDRVGVMGWSYGGLLAAHLAARFPDRIRAASVGAGVTDMRDYHASTDNTAFSLEYHDGQPPWGAPSLYTQSSAIDHVSGRSAPMLIQHGADDDRVPVSNATQLYRRLRDEGVDTALIRYRGAHGVGGLRERLSARRHNYAWFARFLWDDADAWSDDGALPAPRR